MKKIIKGIIAYWYNPNGNKSIKLKNDKIKRINNTIETSIY